MKEGQNEGKKQLQRKEAVHFVSRVSKKRGCFVEGKGEGVVVFFLPPCLPPVRPDTVRRPSIPDGARTPKNRVWSGRKGEGGRRRGRDKEGERGGVIEGEKEGVVFERGAAGEENLVVECGVRCPEGERRSTVEERVEEEGKRVR
jgi:hypothetical protein